MPLPFLFLLAFIAGQTHLVWNIPLVNLDQLFWLCLLPRSPPPNLIVRGNIHFKQQVGMKPAFQIHLARSE